METFLVISTIALWILILFHLLLTFALIRRLNTRNNSKPIVSLSIGAKAPDFTAQNFNGETVTLASFAGRKLALIFIATHCNPCKELLPKVKTLKERAMRGGVEIALVSLEEKDATQRYVEENEVSFPVLIAPSKDNAFSQDYTVSGTPAFCFITAQGIIHSSGFPRFEVEKWTDFENFLAEKADILETRGGDTEKVSFS